MMQKKVAVKKESIVTKIRRAFLLVCLVSLAASSITSLVSLISVRSLTLENGSNIGTAAAENSRDTLRNQTLLDLTEVVQAKSAIINQSLMKAADMVDLLTGYIEQLYRSPEEFRPVAIPNMRQVPPGETRLHWFLETGTVSNPQYNERDLIRSGLREETYLLGNLERVNRLITQNIPDIFTIYVATASGQNVQYDDDADQKAASTGPMILHERPWYTTARDRKGLYISGAYLDFGGRGLTISMTGPFYDREGRFAGVAGIDIRIEDLDKSVRETVVGKSGYAILIDNAGKIVSAPGLNEGNENDTAAYLGDNTEQILAAMLAQPTGTGNSVIKAAGKDTTAAILWSPVELTGWHLVYVIPEEDIFAPALALHGKIIEITETAALRVDKLIFFAISMSGALLLLIIFLTIWRARHTAGKIALPIAALSASVEHIGGGNLDYHSEIKTGDEIEELSLSFERMTEELKVYIRDLRLVTAEKERIGVELNVATKIQESMLPHIFPPYPDRKEFDLYGSMLPAKEVGGDFYDFFLVDENTLMVLIADVSGKGVPAALFMVIAKTLLKNNVQHGLSPKEVFATVNNLLCANNEEGMFVTAFMGFLDIQTGAFTCVNAGHNPPLVKRENGFEWVKIKRGLVLGSIENMSYCEETLTLKKGDMIYLYTDGVTEAQNVKRELFSESRLMEAAEKHQDAVLKEFVVGIKQEIDAFAGRAEQADDITMLVLTYRGTATEGGNHHGLLQQMLQYRGTAAPAAERNMKELEVAADEANLEQVLEFVNAELESVACPSKTQHQIAIVVEELFVNIARYAFSPEKGSALVRVAVSDNEIDLEFGDGGKPYNPLEKPDPDITASVADRPIGGLGIFMVKKMMDSIEYRYENGRNILRLKKLF